MKSLVLCMIFTAELVFSLPSSAHFNSPRCKEMTSEIWRRNSERCFEVFKNAPDPHEPDDKTAKSLCDCVADELVNNMDCKSLKKYETDPKFAAAEEKRITSACLDKLGLKPKK